MSIKSVEFIGVDLVEGSEVAIAVAYALWQLIGGIGKVLERWEGSIGIRTRTETGRCYMKGAR